jgi:hypothetical protein
MATRRKTKKTNKRVAAAQSALDATLRKYGFDPSRPPTLRGVSNKGFCEAPSASRAPLPPTSDTIPGNGTRKDRGDMVYKGDKVVGQLGNKQGFGLIGKDELGNAKRRDR